MRNNNNMEIFKNNLEEQGFSSEFIQKALEYFGELVEEKEIDDYNSLEEVINYYNQNGSFTFNKYKSEENLKELKEDILFLKEQYPELLDLDLYFTNIEHFEISILYLLFYEFYPQEEEEEEIN